MLIGLLGLGAVGAPIAHKLYLKYGGSFIVITDDIEDKFDVLILSVKNYDFILAIEMAEQLISEKTVLVPLENGIWACRYLRNRYRDNIIAECYVRGLDTKKSITALNTQNLGLFISEQQGRRIPAGFMRFMKFSRAVDCQLSMRTTLRRWSGQSGC